MQAFACKKLDDPGRVTVSGFNSRSGPACGNHERGVFVRIRGYAARCADKRFPVPEAWLEALPAGLGRVGRLHQDHADSFGSGLVLDELLELSERPERDHAVKVLVGNSDAIAYPLEILQCDPVASRPDGLRNDLFGKPVIFRGHAPSIQSRKPFQDALGALRALGLKTRADLPPELAIFLDGIAFELPARGECGDIANPKIDAQDAAGCGVGNFAFHDDVAIKPVFGADQSRGLSFIRAPESLVLVDCDIEGRRDPLARMCGEGDDALLELEGECSSVESDELGAVQELPLEFCGLEVSAYAPDGGNREIGRQAVLGADVFVNDPMEFEGIGFPMLPALSGDLGAGFSVSVEEIVENGKTFGRNIEFTANRADGLHVRTITSCLGKASQNRRRGALPLPPKGGSLRASNL